MNIPIYRAKKIDSDEYVEGYYIYNEYENKHYIFISDFFDLFKTQCDHTCVNLEDFIQVCPLTLAIHFPDMLDSKGNKIFASLSEDGKGGDIVNCYLGKNQNIPTREKQTVRYYKPYHIGLKSYDIDTYSKLEIVGIKE